MCIRDPLSRRWVEDLRKRGIITIIDHPVRGEMIVPATPIMMSDSKVPMQTAPVHGGGNEEIYGDWLGISAKGVQKMRANNVF